MKPTARTRVFAILGDPVSHSRSPQIYNAAFAELGLDAVYVAMRCSADDAAGLVRALARAGGGGNVTAPHKQIAAATVERPTEVVQRTGACNTFWLEQGSIAGDNTDVEGFRTALHNHFGPARGQRVLLLGAGGAARAVVAALALDGCRTIDVMTRNPARVQELAAIASDTAVTISAVAAPQHSYDLAINATPLGHKADDPLPIASEHFAQLHGLLDLIYGGGHTPLVRAARAAGLPAFDGSEMLLQQAVAAFQRCWQQPAPVAAMRTALTQPIAP